MVVSLPNVAGHLHGPRPPIKVERVVAETLRTVRRACDSNDPWIVRTTRPQRTSVLELESAVGARALDERQRATARGTRVAAEVDVLAVDELLPVILEQ